MATESDNTIHHYNTHFTLTYKLIRFLKHYVKIYVQREDKINNNNYNY